jgi:hypothetical protein
MNTIWLTMCGRKVFRNWILTLDQVQALRKERPELNLDICNRSGLRDYYRVPLNLETVLKAA